MSDWPAYLSLAVVVAMFALFVTERYPTEVVAIGGLSVMLVTGVLPIQAMLDAIANPAPLTIAAMFILSGALVRTGALDAFTRLAARHVEQRPALVLGGFAAFTIIASAFMNNTPVVVVLIPVAVKIAGALGIKASKLLIPLSYTAILGGVCTLIGTSTNLLVDGVAREQGLAPFTLFEVTPLGLILVAFGLLYLRIFAPRLLPDAESMADALSTRGTQKFFTEVAIPAESTLIGRDLAEVELFKRDGMRIIDVLRGDASLRRAMAGIVLQAGDRVVLRTSMRELLGLKDHDALQMVDRLDEKETATVEALIGPGCRMIGRSLGQMRLRRRYGVYPLAVHRRNQNMARELDRITVRVGDTLLLEGAPEDIRRLSEDMELVDLTQSTERAFRREKAPVVLLALAGVVLAAAFGVLPIAVAAILGMAVVLFARCIDADEAFGAVDGRLLALIFSMLAIGAGLERSGAVALIVEALAPWLSALPPALMLWCVYLLTSLLTEMVSNNAVAVVVTPVAIALAGALGLDPRPFVVAVMVAASAAFATPIGYQTNTLVYGPGGYRFTDFLKVGAPLNLSIGALACLVIPVLWPF